MHHIPPVFPLPAQQHAAPAVAAPGASSKRAGDYSINRACFSSSVHLYRAFLAEKGPKHRETLRYSRLARADAARVIAATPVGGSL